MSPSRTYVDHALRVAEPHFNDPPYRGVEVRGHALLGHADADVIRDIAVRYLGDDAGGTYADRGNDDTLIRLEPGDLRAWDFVDDL
jgi:hypothetical protein